ncbi:MAG TPA: hypothetical protein VGA32_06220 [Anaerolineales bacterium]
MDDRIFAAGGDHIPMHWDEFAGQTGVTAVLHLRPGRPAAFLGLPPESFLWIGVASEGEADLETRWLAGRFVLGGLEAGGRVLLHGSQGRHRVRWAYVAHMICAGRPVAAAVHAAEVRPWLSPYPTDRRAWEEFARLVEARSAERVAAGTPLR